MHIKNKQAFTLVELIVVITIIAILGTIAFISLQGYSSDARDSTRISDMSMIKSSLELYHINTDKYPDPTEAQPVTYSGGLAWYQGIFGNSTFINLDKLDKISKDPLTDKEYAYSVLNTKQAFEIAGIMEGNDIVLNANINQTNAAEKIAKALITGTYNGISLRVNSNDTSYILAMPSIMTSIDLTVEDNRKLETIIPAKELVLTNFENLPSNYVGTSYDSNKETTNPDYKLVNNNDITKLLVYEGDIANLTPTILITKLQESYSGTTIATMVPTKELFQINVTSGTELEKIDSFGVNFINNNLGGASVNRIYSTCNGTAHNTTQSYYSAPSVLFGISCDTVKKDFICIDGIWKDLVTSANISAYPETSCSVDGALNCTYLSTPIDHGDSKTVYSVDSILWNATENCTDTGIEGTVTCNNGINGGNNSYGYLTCAKGTPTNCTANLNYTINGHVYNVLQLNHNISQTPAPTIDIPENNGTFRYTFNALCNDGEITGNETGPVLQTCDTSYHTEDSSTCKSDTKSCTITNGTGTQTWNGTTWNTCTVVTCNTGYYNNAGTSCEIQWTGNITTGYLFKNTSGTGQYPLSCNDLLIKTTWKNTLTGSPWNGTKFNDGVYWIKPDTNPAFKVYCDMSTDQGGWTLLSYVKDTSSLGLYENGNICSDKGENCRGDLKKLGATIANTNDFNELMIMHSNGKRVQMEINTNSPQYKSLINDDVFGAYAYNTYITYDNLHNRIGYIDTLRWRHNNSSTISHWFANATVSATHWHTYATHWDGNDADTGIMKGVGYTVGNSNWNRYSHGFYVREKFILNTWVGNGTVSNPWKKIGNIMKNCNEIRTSISTNPSGNIWSNSSGIGQDGVYNIDPADNGVGLNIYCDMTTDGGGWTLVRKMQYNIAVTGDIADDNVVSLSNLTTDDSSVSDITWNSLNPTRVWNICNGYQTIYNRNMLTAWYSNQGVAASCSYNTGFWTSMQKNFGASLNTTFTYQSCGGGYSTTYASWGILSGIYETTHLGCYDTFNNINTTSLAPSKYDNRAGTAIGWGGNGYVLVR